MSQEELTYKKFITKRGIEARTEWAVTSKLGSVSFWIGSLENDCQRNLYSGVVYHYTKESKPAWINDDSKVDRCKINSGECWTTGSALWASDHWIPNILPLGDEAIWKELETLVRTELVLNTR